MDNYAKKDIFVRNIDKATQEYFSIIKQHNANCSSSKDSLRLSNVLDRFKNIKQNMEICAHFIINTHSQLKNNL